MAEIDSKSLGKVVVILGGSSSEREVSLMSGAGVYNALKEAGADVHIFDPKEQPLQDLIDGKYDRAFIILHGKGGEDGVMQGVLEFLRIPYTGCGVCASAVSMDKVLTKEIWHAQGIPVPKGTTLDEESDPGRIIGELGTHLIVKPSKEGSSIGLYKLENATPEELKATALKAAEEGMQVMVEEFVVGRELTVAVLDCQDGEGLKALPVIEICAPKGDYDYEHKYFSDDTQYICPAQIDSKVEQEIRETVEKAARAVGAEGWSRIDVMLRPDGTFALLEINTAPGMTPHSLVPLAARTSGINYQELVKLVAAGARLKG